MKNMYLDDISNTNRWMPLSPPPTHGILMTSVWRHRVSSTLVFVLREHEKNAFKLISLTISDCSLFYFETYVQQRDINIGNISQETPLVPFLIFTFCAIIGMWRHSKADAELSRAYWRRKKNVNFQKINLLFKGLSWDLLTAKLFEISMDSLCSIRL